MTQTDTKSNYLETVVNCLSQHHNSPPKILPGKPQLDINPDLSKLYGQADSILSQFQSKITRCKKYNQAKIHRKYQIIIQDLSTENKQLTEKLKLEQDARSPTKKHISDILEQLVRYRDENQQLKRTNAALTDQVKQLENELANQTNALLKMQNQQCKNTIQRMPAIVSSSRLIDSIQQYLKDKDHVRRITKKSVSTLQLLLQQLKPKMWNWNICTLLQHLQSWSEGVKERPQVDMWRIRSSIASKFSQHVDQCDSLIKASSFPRKPTSSLNTYGQTKTDNKNRNTPINTTNIKPRLNPRIRATPSPINCTQVDIESTGNGIPYNYQYSRRSICF